MNNEILRGNSEMKNNLHTHAALAAFVITVLIAIGLAVTVNANAVDGPCIPKDAWTETVVDTPATTVEHPAVTHEETTTVVDEPAGWQRYSWTGGPHDEAYPPAFPSADWQPNVKGDPHGIGQEGAYFRSHGGSGKGDWFYLEAIPAVTHEETVIVEDTPAWTEEVPVVTHTVEHPAVVCDPADPEDPPKVIKDPIRPAPPTTTETINTPTKTVKIVREIKTGKVLSKKVIHIDMRGVSEEGF